MNIYFFFVSVIFIFFIFLYPCILLMFKNSPFIFYFYPSNPLTTWHIFIHTHMSFWNIHKLYTADIMPEWKIKNYADSQSYIVRDAIAHCDFLVNDIIRGWNIYIEKYYFGCGREMKVECQPPSFLYWYLHKLVLLLYYT